MTDVRTPTETQAGLAPAPVQLRSVSKVFGRGRQRLEVLTDVSLRVAPGEIVALLGPSGCGKSTLLRLVAGLDEPTAGQVCVDDHPVTGVDPRCAVVFQEPRLLPWRSVSANVRLGTRGRPGDDISSWLDVVGLTDFGDHLPKEISGGMAQRAALARALIGQPGVLLLDEPFAALDALTRLTMQDLLVEVVNRTGATVLLAWCERLDAGRYVFHVLPPSLQALNKPDTSLEHAALLVNQAIERMVLSRPDQYLWGYARDKQPRAGD
jgi:sulfonate transport system ATP-binding protein